LGTVSDADRDVLESLYLRVVKIYSRCVGRGTLELAALSALRGILSDVRGAAGEAEGEILMRVMLADGRPVGPGVLVPQSKVGSWPVDGVIQLRFRQEPDKIDVDPRLVQPGEPNNNGNRSVGI
jgi:hypothetical protein